MTSLVGQDLTYDRRDNVISPTEGFFVRLSTDYAGLGGDLNYARGRLSAGFFVPLTENVVGSLTATGGIIHDLDDQGIRITDRFFLGGSTLRGFKSAGVGPRDELTGDSLGGKQIYYGSLQLRFPIGLPDELGITGLLFSDAGSLTGIDEDPSQVGFEQVVDVPSLRASWGMGIAWKSPIGPLSMDFAWPLKKESFDETEVFRLSFGTRF